MFLLSERDTPVLLGLLVFLVVHSVYVGCFLTLGLHAPAWATTGAVMTILGLVIAHSVLPSAQRQGGIPLAAPVAAYMLALGGMEVVAWGVGMWQIALGATFFVISNTVLGINRWVRPLRYGPVAVIVAYHLAQGLFVAGVTGAA
ncbi:MAG: lysoplasmalogenase family protein [Nocardioides sp.]